MEGMDDKVVKAFLWEQKTWLLSREKIATSKAKSAITSQIQVIDTFFQFLSSTQTETDMEILRLSLDTQAIPIDDIKPRSRKSQMRASILEFIKEIPPGKAKEINAPGISKRTITTTFYDMSKKGELPPEIICITRAGQKEVYLARTKTSDGDGDGDGKEDINKKSKGK